MVKTEVASAAKRTNSNANNKQALSESGKKSSITIVKRYNNGRAVGSFSDAEIAAAEAVSVEDAIYLALDSAETLAKFMSCALPAGQLPRAGHEEENLILLRMFYRMQ